MRQYWVVRLNGGSFASLAHSGEYIAIGWNELGDLSWLRDFSNEHFCRTEIKKLFRKHFPKSPEVTVGINAGQIYNFINKIKINDYIVSPFSENLMLGVIKGEYYIGDTTDGCPYLNRRKVAWIKIIKRDELSDNFKKSLNARQTIFNVNKYGDELELLIGKQSLVDDLKLSDKIKISFEGK